MDMYQKIKERQEIKNKNQESLLSTSINYLITIYLRTFTNSYFIRDYKKFDNAYFI